MTVEQTTQDAHKAAARTTKALALVRVLFEHGATADEARALPPVGRRLAEAVAEVREGSDATWGAVFALLDAADRRSDTSEASDPRPTCPACGEHCYRIDRRYTLGSLRSPGMTYGSIDPTLRHNDDGTVAVEPDGTVVCERTMTGRQEEVAQ